MGFGTGNFNWESGNDSDRDTLSKMATDKKSIRYLHTFENENNDLVYVLDPITNELEIKGDFNTIIALHAIVEQYNK